jgi:hypothetical protein
MSAVLDNDGPRGGLTRCRMKTWRESLGLPSSRLRQYCHEAVSSVVARVSLDAATNRVPGGPLISGRVALRYVPARVPDGIAIQSMKPNTAATSPLVKPAAIM